MMEGPRRRIQLMGILLGGLALVIVAQLVKLQIIDHGFYRDWAEEQQVQSIMMAEPPRGLIRDRNGDLLAGNRVVYSIEAAPPYVVDVEATATALAELLHIPAAHIEQLLSSEEEWVQVAPLVAKEAGEQVAESDLLGITVWPRWMRAYPEGGLASHLLGFCTVDLTGYYGLEGFYAELLEPERLQLEGPVDSASAQIPWAAAPVALPRSGTDLVLTLDRTVQSIAEEELMRAVLTYQAEGGTVIVMEPETFGILALASLPDYEPGRYHEFVGWDPLPFEDPAVSQQYEPGSVFKVLTMAAALDSGLVTPEATYLDRGRIEVGGQVIKNASRREYGEQTMADVLVKSLNVGSAWLSTRMGPDVFYRYVQAFGIGRATGIDLAGEVSGQLWLPGDYEHWHDSNLGTNSFGQGLAATPMQMIVAIATIANDGTRLRAHVVHQQVDHDGSASIFRPMVEAQVVSPQTAGQVTEMLMRVVEEEVTGARVEGYRVAGKTGTAQIPIPGGYDRDETIVSFVGFGPVPDPQLVVLVKLDRPKVSTWAADTAAPAFGRLVGRLFAVLGVPPDNVRVAEGAR